MVSWVYAALSGFCSRFVKHARLLVVLTKEDMEALKQAIVMAPCFWPIDYHCGQTVILTINSSCIATGFILLHLGADSKWYPSNFGSITCCYELVHCTTQPEVGSSEGFRTVASACVLHQPTIVGLSISRIVIHKFRI